MADKGGKKMIFNPSDLVWVHFRKIRCLDKVKSKLASRGVWPLRVNKGDEADLRSNPSKEGGDDANHSTHHVMQELQRPMKRTTTRIQQETISTLLRNLFMEEKNRDPGDEKLKNVIGVETEQGSCIKGRTEQSWRIASSAPLRTWQPARRAKAFRKSNGKHEVGDSPDPYGILDDNTNDSPTSFLIDQLHSLSKLVTRRSP